MKVTTSLSRLSKRDIRKISKIILEWCIAHFGENKRLKKELVLEIDYIQENSGCAEYEIEEERVIRVFIKSIPNILGLICSIIHEYTHDLQPITTYYDKYFKKYKFYSKHPHEIKAYKMEEKFAHVCWNDIKLRLEKMKILDEKSKKPSTKKDIGDIIYHI